MMVFKLFKDVAPTMQRLRLLLRRLRVKKAMADHRFSVVLRKMPIAQEAPTQLLPWAVPMRVRGLPTAQAGLTRGVALLGDLAVMETGQTPTNTTTVLIPRALLRLTTQPCMALANLDVAVATVAAEAVVAVVAVVVAMGVVSQVVILVEPLVVAMVAVAVILTVILMAPRHGSEKTNGVKLV